MNLSTDADAETKPKNSEKRNTKMNALASLGMTSSSKFCTWRLVHSLWFEIIIIILIFFNMVELIVEEVIRSKAHVWYCQKLEFIYAEAIFNALFLLEFLLRIGADKRLFLKETDSLGVQSLSTYGCI